MKKHEGYVLPTTGGSRYRVEGGRKCPRKRTLCCCGGCLIPLLIVIGFLLAFIFNAFMIQDPFSLKDFSSTEAEEALPLFEASDSETRLERAKRLGEAIKFKTISYGSNEAETAQILEFHNFLKQTFPAIHKSPQVTVERIHTYSLLYRIQGSSPEDHDRPYMLCAHLDVTPEGDSSSWTHSPFEGNIGPLDGGEEDYIWGRGSLDNKNAVMGILEAVELILSKGSIPKRTIYLAFGHDEEVGGERGAKYISRRMVELTEENNETIDFILDEGTFILDAGYLPIIDKPIAYVSVIEKGWIDLELTVTGTQTHSSFPPYESPIGILSEAISNLEYNKHPARFGDGVEEDTIRYIRPHANFIGKLIMGNLWLFRPLLSYLYSLKPTTDALQRTTTALTLFKSGVKSNIIPGVAKVTVNHRVYQDENLDVVLQRDADTIGDDRVKFSILRNHDPSPVSPFHNNHIPFQVLANAINQTFPSSVLVPGVLTGGTDTKHYVNLCSSIYRFTPIVLNEEEVKGYHGIDERISVKNYNKQVEFYHSIISFADRALNATISNGHTDNANNTSADLCDDNQDDCTDYELLDEESFEDE